jgi:hypothetical protein
MFKLDKKWIDRVIECNCLKKRDLHKIGRGLVKNKTFQQTLKMRLCKDIEWIVYLYPEYFIEIYKKQCGYRNLSKKEKEIINRRRPWVETEQDIIDTTMANKPLYERVPQMAKELSPYDGTAKTVKDYLSGEQEAIDLVILSEHYPIDVNYGVVAVYQSEINS